MWHRRVSSLARAEPPRRRPERSRLGRRRAGTAAAHRSERDPDLRRSVFPVVGGQSCARALPSRNRIGKVILTPQTSLFGPTNGTLPADLSTVSGCFPLDFLAL